MRAPDYDQIRHKFIHAIEGGHREYAERLLDADGLADVRAALRADPLVRHTFSCPHHHAKVVTPCRLPCRFHVKSEIANNCLLAYCHQQGIDKLSTDEVAYLYDIPIHHVEETIDSAMGSIRLAAMQAEAAEDPDAKRVFRFIETTDLCAVCGSPTDDTKTLVAGTPLAYCSRDCQNQLPPAAVLLEWRFGRPVAVCLDWAFRRFKNLPLLERTFGIDRAVLGAMSRRYLGKSLMEFFPKAKLAGEMSFRRPSSDKTFGATLREPLQKIVDEFRSRYGAETFCFKELTSLLTGLV